MKYDAVIIGGGLSGLTAASLLAKRGLKVAVIDKSYNPGGSCGIFKRNNVIFDQGSSMLFGFGEKGFNTGVCHSVLDGTSKNKIPAINRDMENRQFDVLLLASDDKIGEQDNTENFKKILDIKKEALSVKKILDQNKSKLQNATVYRSNIVDERVKFAKDIIDKI